MTRSYRRQAISLMGFYFAPGPLSADNDGFGPQFFDALMGKDVPDLTLHVLRDRVRRSLTSTYSAVVQHKNLFMALRGGDIVWQASSP